ncbi:IS66 family insertion sequence element accessory protein TnpB [Methylovulum psychrotolerans]|uniref:IS66 family insertion sequence element accessory protein TnpB n=1 Tax=Methylovulum psychrotolerans TaxID=1704499 RepID=UPI0012F75840|nr:IS66 family insertion sequence element accessory protein TnpB [Methylovulum psychrotolerans]
MPGLIPWPPHIWLAVSPVDMRKGADGLSAIVQQALGHKPCAGSAFVFRNRAGNRLKLLLWESPSTPRPARPPPRRRPAPDVF